MNITISLRIEHKNIEFTDRTTHRPATVQKSRDSVN